MRIAQVNGKCPCQRCQRGRNAPARLLADVASQRAGYRPSSLSLGTQVRLLLARAKRGS
jgi:hypothetical protein